VSSGSERARDNRSQRNANAAGSVTVEKPATQEPAHVAQPASPPAQDKGVASTKPAEKNESSKSEEKKDDKKSGGIGGAIKGGFKKIFGGGDKNKNEKKP